MSSLKMIKLLKKHGFKLVRIVGDHHRFKHPDGRATTVPHPNKDLKKGTEQTILKQAKLK